MMWEFDEKLTTEECKENIKNLTEQMNSQDEDIAKLRKIREDLKYFFSVDYDSIDGLIANKIFQLETYADNTERNIDYWKFQLRGRK